MKVTFKYRAAPREDVFSTMEDKYSRVKVKGTDG